VTPRFRRRVLIALGVVAGLNAAVYAAYTLPRAHGERRLAERKRLLAEELQRERAVAADRRYQADTIRMNAEDVRRFYTTTLTGRTASLVPVLSAIEGFAREGGMRPGSATYRAAAVKGLPLDRFEIEMPVSGTYRQLVALVQRLERSQYFLTLDEVSLRQGVGRGSAAELTLGLSAYFKSAGAPAP
jgi:hypothetical protein